MKDDTKVVVKGRHPQEQFGAVNPPVVHASTILYRDIEAFRNMDAYVSYGRHGSPSNFSLREAMADLEGGHASLLTSSGLAAVTTAILSFVQSGDHFLMVDTTYGPTRSFCRGALRRFGVETTFYDPLIGSEIKDLIRPNTKAIFMESPGSHTFEMQDVPAIVAAAKDAGDIITILDNTWASPLFYKPLAHDVDVCVHAATKYIVGHSDAMLGVITSNEACWDRIDKMNRYMGGHAAPDDSYLGQRGLRTLSVRMARHEENAHKLITFLKSQPEVSRILYPGDPDDPGYEIWKRDFSGSSGLFGVVFNGGSQEQGDAFLSALAHFGLGFSWGGYESLMIPSTEIVRSVRKWQPEGQSFRIHAGLEDADDLIADLEAGFRAWRAVGA
ncbi:MAG: cystathionine beta-lyase [Alphaproteobacteria bacterium]|nr:MAG: cystathionine beta-lyase [Alphaproteobacteria bacterium]